MRPFFENHNLKVNILNLLEQKPTWTYSELSHYIKTDRATITKNVKQLIQIIDARSSSEVELEKTSQGITYRRTPGFNLAFLLPMLTDNRLSTIFEIIFSGHQLNLTKLSNKLFASESTTRRLLKNINQKLKEYKVEIDTRSMKFRGSEPNIRYAAFQYFWNTYGSVFWPFKVSKKNILKICSDNNIPLNDQLRYAFWIAVCHTRQLKGYTLLEKELPNSKNPEHDFLKLIYIVDFSSPYKLNTLPGYIPISKLKFNVFFIEKNILNYLSATHYYNSIFGRLPLLYDRSFQLDNYLRIVKHDTLKQIKRICENNPLLILKTCELLQITSPLKLFNKVKLSLVTDSDPIERYATQNMINNTLNNYIIEWVEDYDNADLIITNLTLQTLVPIAYVNTPISLSDLELLQSTLVSIFSKKQQV